MYEHARKYNLTGTDAMVFEALCSLCRKTGEWKGSFATLARYSCCGNRNTAFYAVERLISKGLVFKIGTGVFKISTEVFKIDTEIKEERTKEENININKSPTNKEGVGLLDFSLDFLDFWKAFNVNPKYDNRQKACYKIWQTMPNDWKTRARECAACHEPDANPFWWLQKEVYLRVDPNAQVATEPDAKAAPIWLDHEQQYQLLQGGAELMFCRRPDGKGFGTVTQADAERFGLEVVRKVKL